MVDSRHDIRVAAVPKGSDCSLKFRRHRDLASEQQMKMHHGRNTEPRGMVNEVADLLKTEELDLWGSAMSPPELAFVLTQAMKSQHLQVLDVGRNDLTRDSIYIIASMLQTSTELRELRMSGCRLSDPGAEIVGKAMRATFTLESLALECDEISDRGIVSLCNGIEHGCPKLLSLNLANNLITSAGIDILACSLMNSKGCLQRLDLRRNSIDDNGVGALAAWVQQPMCQIAHLDLSENLVTDLGATALSEALAACRLETLQLHGNRIDVEGSKALAEKVHENRTLRWLTMTDSESKIDVQHYLSSPEVSLGHEHVIDAVFISETLKHNPNLHSVQTVRVEEVAMLAELQETVMDAESPQSPSNTINMPITPPGDSEDQPPTPAAIGSESFEPPTTIGLGLVFPSSLNGFHHQLAKQTADLATDDIADDQSVCESTSFSEVSTALDQTDGNSNSGHMAWQQAPFKVTDSPISDDTWVHRSRVDECLGLTESVQGSNGVGNSRVAQESMSLLNIGQSTSSSAFATPRRSSRTSIHGIEPSTGSLLGLEQCDPAGPASSQQCERSPYMSGSCRFGANDGTASPTPQSPPANAGSRTPTPQMETALVPSAELDPLAPIKGTAPSTPPAEKLDSRTETPHESHEPSKNMSSPPATAHDGLPTPMSHLPPENLAIKAPTAVRDPSSPPCGEFDGDLTSEGQNRLVRLAEQLRNDQQIDSSRIQATSHASLSPFRGARSEDERSPIISAAAPLNDDASSQGGASAKELVQSEDLGKGYNEASSNQEESTECEPNDEDDEDMSLAVQIGGGFGHALQSPILPVSSRSMASSESNSSTWKDTQSNPEQPVTSLESGHLQDNVKLTPAGDAPRGGVLEEALLQPSSASKAAMTGSAHDQFYRMNSSLSPHSPSAQRSLDAEFHNSVQSKALDPDALPAPTRNLSNGPAATRWWDAWKSDSERAVTTPKPRLKIPHEYQESGNSPAHTTTPGGVVEEPLLYPSSRAEKK